MSLTKQDFTAIAKQLLAVQPKHTEEIAYNQWKQCVIGVAIGLRASNPSFKEGEFLKACGYVSQEHPKVGKFTWGR